MSSTFYSFVVTHCGVRADGDRAGRRRRPAHRPRAARAGPPDAARRRSSRASRETVVLLYGVTAMLLVAAAVEAFWSSAQLAAAVGQVQRRGGVLDRRARLFHAPGPPCRLTRSPSGCGRARRWRPPISACACARARRASVYRCYLRSRPSRVLLAAGVVSRWPSWLPTLVIWWLKPWLDRTILFVLSRAAFGQTTTPGDLWRAQRHVWWRQFLFTLTVRRLSPWRSFTQPVYQLEGGSALGAARAHAADAQSRRGLGVPDDAGRSPGRDRRLTIGVVLAVVLVRAGRAWRRRSAVLRRRGQRARGARDRQLALCDRRAVPRAVLRRGRFRACTLNRRAELEALGHRAGVPACVRAVTCARVGSADRRAAARRVAAGRVGAGAADGAGARRLDAAEIARALDAVKADPNLATERTIKTLRWKIVGAAEPAQMPGWLVVDRRLLRVGRANRPRLSCGRRRGAGRDARASISRASRARGSGRRRADTFVAPTHVRDLDIRPESLPARHRRGGARLVGPRRAPGRAGAAVSRPAVAARARARRADPGFEHRRRLPRAGARRACRPRTTTSSRLVRVWQRCRLRPPADRHGGGSRTLRRLRRGARPASAATPRHAARDAVTRKRARRSRCS